MFIAQLSKNEKIIKFAIFDFYFRNKKFVVHKDLTKLTFFKYDDSKICVQHSLDLTFKIIKRVQSFCMIEIILRAG